MSSLTTTPSSTTSTTRKYLCAAPRPDVWDHHVQAVVPPFGSLADAQRALETTLTQIRHRHPFTPKQGPGRKSNAEHAVHFYEYILAQIKKKQRNTSGGSGASTSPFAVAQQDEDDEEEPQQQQADEQPNETTEPKEEEAKPAATTQQSSKTSKTTCKVCFEVIRAPKSSSDTDMDITKQSIACDSCHAVFHQPCFRPLLEEFVPTVNRCAYCVLQTEPKHARPRKQAASAVRLMARLRNQHLRKKAVLGETVNENDDKDEDPPAAAPTESEAATATTAETVETADNNDKDDKEDSEASRKREAAALSKLANTFASPQEEQHVAPDTGRGKRVRKQPTLYDPQDVPAREWQSDEVLLFESSSSSSDSDEETKRKKQQGDGSSTTLQMNLQARKQHRAEGGEPGGVWCGFCGDDPAIPVCCFCACRVCFGKHNQTQLLLCDRCDDEYHTFCLTPPLQAVPQSKSWFCGPCLSTEERRHARSSPRVGTRGLSTATTPAAAMTTTTRKDATTTTSPTRRSSGRKAAQQQHAAQKMAEEKPSVGRPRGRPATTKSPTLEAPRKRGRPPKTATAITSTATMTPTSEPPKKRARISSKQQHQQAVATVAGTTTTAADQKKLTKSAAITKSETLEPVGAEPSLPVAAEEVVVPVTVSRSGRMVKRSTFHDEIVQGDQHLRSSSSSSNNNAAGRIEDATLAVSRDDDDDEDDDEDPDEDDKMEIDTTTIPPTDSGGSNVMKAMEVTPKMDAAVMLPAVATTDTPVAASLSATALPKQPSTGTPTDMEKTTTTTIAEPTTATVAGSSQAKAAPVVASPGVSAASSSTPAPTPTVTAAAGTTVLPPSQPAVPAAAAASAPSATASVADDSKEGTKQPRRKPGARECMQISRRFGVRVIPEKYMDILLDYCTRGKVEHLIRMRERLDDHARYLESQLAGLEAVVQKKGEHLDIKVPAIHASTEKLEHASMQEDN